MENHLQFIPWKLTNQTSAYLFSKSINLTSLLFVLFFRFSTETRTRIRPTTIILIILSKQGMWGSSHCQPMKDKTCAWEPTSLVAWKNHRSHKLESFFKLVIEYNKLHGHQIESNWYLNYTDIWLVTLDKGTCYFQSQSG